MLIINKDSLDCHLVAPHCRPLYPTSGQDCRPQGRDGHRPDPRPPHEYDIALLRLNLQLRILSMISDLPSVV